MDGSAIDVSIITVNYNGGTVLRECMAHILRHITVPFEVIILDNDSSDHSLELLPHDSRIRIIRSAENLGFARGNNLAALSAKGRLFHFLNPDIYVNGTLNDHYKLALAEGNNAIYVNSLLDGNGIPQQMEMLIPTFGNYLKRIFRPSASRRWSIGASLMMYPETFEKIGKWSEAYFMYSEDLDMFYTAQQRGVRIVQLDTNLIHIGKVSSASVWSEQKRADIVEQSFMKFFKRHSNVMDYIVVRTMHLIYQIIKGDKTVKYTSRAFLKTLF